MLEFNGRIGQLKRDLKVSAILLDGVRDPLYMTTEMWGRVCMKVAEADMNNMDVVASAAKSVLAPDETIAPHKSASSSDWIEL